MNAASVHARRFGTLTDTGPLYALVDEDGQAQNFARCDALLPLVDSPLVTTWPCLAEAMYLCGQSGCWRGTAQSLSITLAREGLEGFEYNLPFGRSL